jgi:hypothetical protein
MSADGPDAGENRSYAEDRRAQPQRSVRGIARSCSEGRREDHDKRSEPDESSARGFAKGPPTAVRLLVL